MSTQEQVIELNAKLTAASEAYYKRNQPIMADAEFDALERELKALVAQSPELVSLAPVLSRVGSDLTGGRIPHARPMLSIENKYEEQDLIDWYAGLPYHQGVEVCVEPKFDGISASLIYQDCMLVQALTRGDGKSGEDITRQVFATGTIPQVLPATFPKSLEVRGELVMRNSTLERINREAEAAGGKTYSSTRNLTGGTMKLKDTSVIPSREILLMPWDVLVSDPNWPDSGLMRLIRLVEAGFAAPMGRLTSDGVQLGVLLRIALADREKVLRRVHSLETDGVVIKVDSHALRQKFGTSTKYTNWQVCFKSQSASGTTYLRSIEWQVGRTGKVSPVAVCDPVILAGAKIEHANLNNITWIREKGLKLGAKVEMLRSGDVIPQITRVLDEGESEIIPPPNCPECHAFLEESDEGGAGTLTHRCPNKGCPGRIRDTLTFIGSRECLEIDGLGPEMAAKLIKENYARSLADLCLFQTEGMTMIRSLGEEQFVERARKLGFDATILKLVKSFERAKAASWERWIKALCIPMIGATLGKVIASALDLGSEDMKGLPGLLLKLPSLGVEGLGEAKLGSITDWANDIVNVEACLALHGHGVRPAPIEKPKIAADAPLKGISFCITGEFDEDRDTITKKLVSLGASAKSGVSSKVNLLIVGDAAGKSKLKKAEELKIKQVGKEWLTKTLADNGLTA